MTIFYSYNTLFLHQFILVLFWILNGTLNIFSSSSYWKKPWRSQKIDIVEKSYSGWYLDFSFCIYKVTMRERYVVTKDDNAGGRQQMKDGKCTETEGTGNNFGDETTLQMGKNTGGWENKLWIVSKAWAFFTHTLAFHFPSWLLAKRNNCFTCCCANQRKKMLPFHSSWVYLHL